MASDERRFALVEQLRQRPQTARELADMLEVTPRTVERDIAMLRRSGMRIVPMPGRRGGYQLDGEPMLPPVSFAPDEAIAVLVALHASTDGFGRDAATARAKLTSAMGAERARHAEVIARATKR